MIRFATIGTNFIVDWFLRDSAPVSELKYSAVYSRNQDTANAFANKYGVKKTYTDLDALASDPDIDAVYIASPNNCHCHQAVKMLNAKKHVLCEKPIATTYEEYKLMCDAAKKNGVILMEAMRSVYDPAFLKMEELLSRIGKVRRASFEYCQYSSRYDRFKNGIMTNAFDKKFRGGSLMDIGVYCVHPLVKLFGMPDKVFADAVMLNNGLDGAGTAVCTYNDGMQAELIFSKISEGYRASQIQGEKGTIVIDSIHNPFNVTLYVKGLQPEVYSFEKADWNMLYEAQVFCDMINGRTENDLTASENEMLLLDMIRERIGLSFE